MIQVPHSYGPESPAGYITPCLKEYHQPLYFFRFISVCFSVLATWAANNLFIGWSASIYRSIDMVDSIRCYAQNSVTVRFSFMAGFTWRTTAFQLRYTNIFFSRLTGKKFSDCISCLTTERILFQFEQTIAFSSFHTCLSFIMSEYISFLCSIYLQSFHLSVLPQARQSNPLWHF